MRRIGRGLLVIVLALPVAALLLIGLFSRVDPPVSALMLWRAAGGQPIDYRPMPLGRIAPALAQAVLSSEDNHFCTHRGVDWGAVREAIREAEDGSAPRGASTIAMQVAKNLFLWPERSYVRKAAEVPLALAIDLLWTKRRTIEVYLNIVEWGPGIYGAEAAARRHFGRPATELTVDQAALLAATLPAPLARNASAPGPVTRRAAARIERRMGQTSGSFACIG